MKITTTLFVIGLFTCNCIQAIEVQGHRGARSVLPENSLAGFQYALEVGVDTLELDTGVTKDGHVVIVHDQKVNTTICQNKDGSPIQEARLINKLTLKELKMLDCGSLVNPRFTEQTLRPLTEIPTLRELFELVNNSTVSQADVVKFNIETKSDPKFPDAQPNPRIFASLILNLIDEYELSDRVTLQSFDHRTLLAAKSLNPDIKLAALFDSDLSDWVTPTLAAKADIVSPMHHYLSAEEVNKIHAAGLTVIPWTANKESEWLRLINMNVDGIITDDPKPLIDMLRDDDSVTEPPHNASSQH